MKRRLDGRDAGLGVSKHPGRSLSFPIPESRITIHGLYWNRIE